MISQRGLGQQIKRIGLLKFFLAGWLLLCCCLTAWGQPLAFRRFNDRDGLPQSQIYSILEDKDGFIWVGSDEGVARLGASGIRTFGRAQGLQLRIVTVLFQDRKGSIWGAGVANGLSEIRGQLVRNYGKAEGLDAGPVHGLVELADGTLLVGAEEGLFKKVEDHFEKLILPLGWGKMPGYALLEDGKDIYLGGKEGRIIKWRGNSVQALDLPEESRQNGIKTLQKDPSGRLWALAGTALYCYGKPGWQRVALPSLPAGATVRSMTMTAEGEMLFALGTEGLLLRKPDGVFTHLTYKDGIWREGVHVAHRDRRGMLWLGTDGGYLMVQAVPGLRELSTDPETGIGRGLKIVSCFRELSPHRMLLGGSGISLWDECEGSLSRWNQMEDGTRFFAWNMAKSPRGDIWIATTKGLACLRGNRLMPGPESLKSTFIGDVVVHQGRLWAGTNDMQVIELTLEGKILARHPLPSGNTGDLLIKLLPRPWGLLCLSKLGAYRLQDGLGSSVVPGIPKSLMPIASAFEEPAGRLWLATHNGVYGFQNDDFSKWVHVGDELDREVSSNWVQRLPSGHLALGADRAVNFIKQGKGLCLNQNSGLISNETVAGGAYLDSQGRLWIGMMEGASILDTRIPLPESSLPPPKVVEARWGRYSTWLPEALEVPPGAGTVELVFDTPAPALPSPLKYQTLIQGLDKDWRMLAGSSNVLQLAGLGPGHYAFQVRCSQDGYHWAESKPLPFTVQPAWHQRLLVRSLMILAALGLVFLLVQNHMRRLERRAEILEEAVRERTKELENRNQALERVHHQLKHSLESRIQLVRMVSHDMRSPLASIMLSVDRLRVGHSSSNFEAVLGVMEREATRLEGIIRSLLDQAKAESLHRVTNQHLCCPSEVLTGLMETLCLKAENRGLKAELDLDPYVDKVWIMADPTSLQQVLFNLIENALKFTEAPGTVGIRSKVAEGSWILEVWDTGRGIAKESLENVFHEFSQVKAEDASRGWGLGLSICRSLIEAHRGAITAESQIGCGSCFKVVLPLVNVNL